jgi:Protein of unknown function (DUF2800)
MERALKIRPSGLDRVIRCPGSALACKDIKFVGNKYTERGLKLHQLAALIYDVGESAWNQVKKEIEGEDLKDFQDVIAQAHQLEPVGEFRALVEHKEGLEMFDMDSGTPDLVFITPQKSAVLIDFKFGHGLVENPADNWQMKAYAAALCVNHLCEVVEAYILQPGAWDGKTIKGATFRKDRKDFDPIIVAVKEGVKKARDPLAPRIPGKAQCVFCPAKETCPEFQAGVQAKETEKREERGRDVQVGEAIALQPPLGFANPVVVISKESIAKANYLCEQAMGLQVSSPENAQLASDMLKDIGKFLRDVKAVMDEVKEPYKDFVKKADLIGAQALIPLNTGKDKLKVDLDKWTADQEALKRKAEAEAAEVERKKQEAIRQAEEAKRREEEAQRRAAEAKGAAEKKKAQEALAKAQAESQAKAKEAQAQLKVEAPAPVISAPPTGLKQIRVPRYDVLDFKMLADEYKIANDAVILAAIKSGKLKEPGVQDILKVWWEVKTSSTGR